MFRRPQSDDEDDYVSSKPSVPQQTEADLMDETLMNITGDNSQKSKSKQDPKDSEKDTADIIMSHDELNALAAKVIKAELMGNTDKAAKLKAKLEKARALAAVAEHQSTSQATTVKKGMANLQRKRQQAMEAEEKMSSKFVTGDGTVGRSSKEERRKRYYEGDEGRKEPRGKSRKYERSLGSCDGCSASKDNSTLVYDSGKAIVQVSKRNILDGNHFHILPKEHFMSAVYLDEDVADDVNKIKKALIETFSKQNKAILFFEINKEENHMSIGGIPVDSDAVGNLRRFLHNSFDLLNEGSSSFSKNLNDVPGGLRRFMRPGVAYTWFGFGDEQGYAYRLTSDNDFEDDFYYSNIGGELDDDFDDMQLRMKHTPDIVKKNRDELRKNLEAVLS